jgi:hypothetical protein
MNDLGILLYMVKSEESLSSLNSKYFLFITPFSKNANPYPSRRFKKQFKKSSTPSPPIQSISRSKSSA